MRSAFIFLDYLQEEIIEFLNVNFNGFDNLQWTVHKDNDPVLYIRFDEERSLLNDLAECEINLLRAKFRSFPCQILTIDISGRHHGEKELLNFLKVLLDRFDALVMDDYTEHLWTYEEICNGVKVRNHKFFDFIGWHNETHYGEE